MHSILYMLSFIVGINEIYTKYLRNLMYLHYYEENPKRLDREHGFKTKKISYFTMYMKDYNEEALYVFENFESWKEANKHRMETMYLIEIDNKLNNDNWSEANEMYMKLKETLSPNVSFYESLGATLDKQVIESIIQQKRAMVIQLSSGKVIKNLSS
ncbi:hypothetical protein H311_04166 [Anncaliia algerae PRA109]|nr:hypothetical protein H311_04166 [Anncaliia algerae PRA109]